MEKKIPLRNSVKKGRKDSWFLESKGAVQMRLEDTAAMRKRAAVRSANISPIRVIFILNTSLILSGKQLRRPVHALDLQTEGLRVFSSGLSDDHRRYDSHHHGQIRDYIPDSLFLHFSTS